MVEPTSPAPRSARWRRSFAPPLLMALVIVSTSPVIGHARDVIFDTFGDAAPKILVQVLALLGGAGLLWTLSRIREQRAPRYIALGVVFALIAWQTLGWGTGLAEVDAVEKIHIVEYGLLAALLYGVLHARGASFWELVSLPLVWSGLVGVADESTQAFFQLRTGDFRDVLLNLFAGLCGWIFAWALAPVLPAQRPAPHGHRHALSRVGRWLSVLIVALGVFFDALHLGYEIEHPDIGRFRSWFTEEQLLRLQQDRAEKWARDAPDRLYAWDKEDYYLTEAARHASHRNSSFQNHHWTAAWHANLILETYFAPFLDLRSFRNAGRHRYPPQRRARLGELADRDPQGFVSAVHLQRIVVWPRGPFYAVVWLLAGLCWLPTWLGRRRPASLLSPS